MAHVDDSVLDAFVQVLVTDGALRVDMCTPEPTTFTEATVTNSLGNAASVTMTGPTAASPRGRRCTVPQISGGTATANGTPTHWALTRSSTLLVVGDVASSDAFVTPGTWGTTAAWNVDNPGVA